jgi:predicted dehydrogenase
MMNMTRRSLIYAPLTAAWVRAASDTVNVAVIGVGGRGGNHISLLGRQANCRVAAICDVNQAAQERAVAQVEKMQGHKPKVYGDMRRLFEDREIDAVSMATPNHWHALGTIWACQAGKDVYVEKPACHNVWEGFRMIEAARKYSRIVQVGSQSRSTAVKMRAIELLKQGIIGDVYMAKGLCYKWRPSIGHTPEEPVPPGVDWDLFLGPAPKRPFTRNRLRYNWHWFWDTGNGDLGNQGVHEVDICRWGLGEIGLPKSVVSTGGKYVYQDDQETPNVQSAVFDYGARQIVFEVHGLHTGTESDVAYEGGNIVGNVFYGSEGYLAVDPAGFRVFKGRGCAPTAAAPSAGCRREKIMEEKAQGPEGGYDGTAHFGTFLKAVRSRNPKDLTAPVDVGVQSAALCHLANISYRLGRRLACDPTQWKFTGDEEANRMLTREYRAPYVVPERV